MWSCWFSHFCSDLWLIEIQFSHNFGIMKRCLQMAVIQFEPHECIHIYTNDQSCDRFRIRSVMIVTKLCNQSVLFFSLLCVVMTNAECIWNIENSFWNYGCWANLYRLNRRVSTVQFLFLNFIEASQYNRKS